MSFSGKTQIPPFSTENIIHENGPRDANEQIWYILKTYYTQLLGLNIFFILICVPVFTIPAAISGMTNILMNRIKDKPVYFWKEFFIEFRTDFIKRLLVWLLLMIAPVSLSFYPHLLGMNRGSPIILVITGILSLIFQSYFFSIIVLINISVGSAIKNAIILTFVEWKVSLRIMFTTGTLAILFFFFPLYILPFMAIGLLVIIQLMTCVWTYSSIKERLIIN